MAKLLVWLTAVAAAGAREVAAEAEVRALTAWVAGVARTTMFAVLC